MATLEDKKQFALDFERTINLGKARAYSKISLERPLTNQEFQEYKRLMESLN